MTTENLSDNIYFALKEASLLLGPPEPVRDYIGTDPTLFAKISQASTNVVRVQGQNPTPDLQDYLDFLIQNVGLESETDNSMNVMCPADFSANDLKSLYIEKHMLVSNYRLLVQDALDSARQVRDNLGLNATIDQLLLCLVTPYAIKNKQDQSSYCWVYPHFDEDEYITGMSESAIPFSFLKTYPAQNIDGDKEASQDQGTWYLRGESYREMILDALEINDNNSDDQVIANAIRHCRVELLGSTAVKLYRKSRLENRGPIKYPHYWDEAHINETIAFRDVHTSLEKDLQNPHNYIPGFHSSPDAHRPRILVWGTGHYLPEP